MTFNPIILYDCIYFKSLCNNLSIKTRFKDKFIIFCNNINGD